MAERDEVEDVELLHLCTGLGRVVENDEGVLSYKKEENTKESLRGLLRLLASDDERRRPVFRKLGRWKIFSTNLLPLLVVYRDDFDLCFQTLKMIVRMSMPVMDHKPRPEQARDRDERKSLLDYNVLAECHAIMLEQKKAYLDTKDVSKVVMGMLSETLAGQEDEREDLDVLLLELVLTLYRNLLHVPEAREPSRKRELLILQDRVLAHLKRYHVIDTVLYLARGVDQGNKEFNFLIAEILANCFRDEEPDVVVKGAEQYLREKEEEEMYGGRTSRSHHTRSGQAGQNGEGSDEEEEDAVSVSRAVENPLSSILSGEKKRRDRLMKSVTGRHSRFGGAFVMKDKDGKRVFLNSQTRARPSDQHLNIGISRDKRPFQDPRHRRSVARSRSVYHFLFDIASKFISQSFNPLIASILSDYMRERRTIYPADERYFCLLTSFAMGLHRVKEDKARLTQQHAIDVDMSPVRAALTLDCFRFIFKLVDEHFIDKSYSRLPHAVALLTEMFRSIRLLSMSKVEQNRDVADHLIAQIVYSSGDKLDLIGKMLNEYLSPKLSRSHLENLVILSSTFLELMIRTNSNMELISKKKKKRRAKKRAEEGDEGPVNTQDEVDEVESMLDVGKTTRKFALPGLVGAIAFVLEEYPAISVELAQSIRRLLDCICVDAKMEPMLYQASLFSVTMRMLNDPDLDQMKGAKLLAVPLSDVINNFTRSAVDHPHLFADFLFWKPPREVVAILEKIDPENINVSYLLEKRDAAARKGSRGRGGAGEGDFEGAGVVSSSIFSPWDGEEDRILEETYTMMKESPFCMDVLKAALLGREEQQIRQRVVAKGIETDVALVPKSAVAEDIVTDTGRSRSLVHSQLDANREAVMWVFASLRDALELRRVEEEGRVSIENGIPPPLVPSFALTPVSDFEWAAVQDAEFQELLCFLHFTPAAAGRCFWRLDGDTPTEKVREAADFLAGLIEEEDEHRGDELPSPTMPLVATGGEVLDTPALQRYPNVEIAQPVSSLVSPFKERDGEGEKESVPSTGKDGSDVQQSQAW